MKAILGATLVALLGVSALSVAAEAPLACRTSLVPLKYRVPVEDLATGNLPLPDYQNSVFKCRNAGSPGMQFGPPQPAPIPESAWLASERARYIAVLSAQPADVLIAPFEVQGYGLDRIERALMAADLAYAIGDAGPHRVADPFLTALALGEGQRRFDRNAVESLAEKIGARWILTGYVGHDLHHAFTLSLELRDLRAGGGSKPWRQDWRSVAFTDEETPAYVLHQRLPELLKSLPLGLASVTAKAPGGPPASPTHISVGPAEFVAMGARAAPSQAAMTLLAALVPGNAELASERLFERALIASIRANHAQSSQRFFEAYALLNLHRRPAALARIEGAEGPRFNALRALLNGDLPAARSATGAVKNPFDRFLLELLIRDMEYDYRVGEPRSPASPLALFGSVSDAWLPLYTTRFGQRERSFVADASSLKEHLDRTIPMPGLSLESVVSGARVVRKVPADEVDIDLASVRHVQKFASTLPTPTCCHTKDLLPGQWDLFWLLEGAVEDRITRELRTRIFVQGDARGALDAITRYEPLLKGHPLLTVLSASAMHGVAARSVNDERANWTQRGLEAGRAAIRWTPGQNHVAYEAALSLGIPSGDNEFWLDIYGYDYPRRPDWPLEFFGNGDPAGDAQLSAFAAESMAFTTTDLSFLDSMPGGSREALIANLGTRFTGHFARPTTKPTRAIDSAGTTTAEGIAAAQAAAASDPKSYCQLGYLLLHSEHALKESRDALLLCPSFKPPVLDRILTSNIAADSGSMYFWLGEGDLAKPFFQISNNLQTGSDGAMASEQRLRLLGGDLRGAAEIAQRRSLRYSNSFAQRDYLSLLHAFGKHDAAWSGFSQLWPAQGEPALWTSALVGYRMQKLDEKALRAWLHTAEIRSAKVGTQLFASYFALLWSSTDRVPAADLGALVEELEGPRVAQWDSGGVIRPHPVDPSGFEFVRQTFNPVGVPGVAALPEGTKLKSERAYFADAYSAVVRGEYVKAVERFGAMARLYPVDGATMPYFAYAAAKTGDTLKFEAHVMAQSPSQDADFDVLLSRAFFAAGRKQVDEAYRLLSLAFRAKPYSGLGSRPVDVHYQFAQACEWLYRDTQDRRFARTLLEWAKRFQAVEPVAAWAYAVQFQYETDPAQRVRALALTLYLDPLSERIRRASKTDLNVARSWLDVHNPFLGEKPKPLNDVEAATRPRANRSARALLVVR